VPAEAAAYYIEILKKVSETPEWKEYLERTSQTGRFMGGEDFKTFVAADYARFRGVFAEQGWLVK
jgi:tripartite-type tricarboxylate transporter receptor subunit TctC